MQKHSFDEIAFTASIATIVTAYPSPELPIYTTIKTLSIGLLILSLIRKIVVIEENRKTAVYLTHMIDPLTYISLFYLHYVLIKLTNRLLTDSLPLEIVYAMSLPLFVVLVYLAWELLIGSAIGEAVRSLEATSERHRQDIMGAFFGHVANQLQQTTNNSAQTKQSQLSDYLDSPSDIEDYPTEVIIGVGFATLRLGLIILLLFTSYTSLFFISGVLSDVSASYRAILLVSTILCSGLVRLWDSSYGGVNLEDRNGFAVFGGTAVSFFVLLRLVGQF
jgi:hypothetical protein